MTAAEFKKKWARYQGKETSAYQEHFSDLCRLLGQPTPAEADSSGSDFFCFQKRVIKDAELLELEPPDASEPNERGFADVWKKGCFAWEYKGKKKNLDEAYKQLLRYRESLLNPPLLVVCDFDRYIVKTNFNGTVQEVHEFTNADIDRPENLRILRALFENPEFLKPQRTTAQVTENLAAQIGEVARSLQKRESVELADTRTRDEFRVGQKKNLRIARFLNRIVFCFFAEDTGLLPKKLFTELLKTSIDDLKHFAVTLEKLFQVMAKGGTFGKDKIRHFNGHLFEDSTVFELTEEELRKLADASEADWQFIQPSIMGTLFQRALDESQRAALGAQYTGEPDIRDLVEPVLMAPLRREWAVLKAELVGDGVKSRLVGVEVTRLKSSAAAVGDDVRRRRTAGGKSEPPHVVSYKEKKDKLAAFLKKLRTIIVMDPACGSGNFLYVSLQMLLGLEKEVINFAAQLGFRFELEVSVQQLRAIEINPYAFELAQVSVQIGFLQWRRDNGFDNDRSPVLQNLDGFQNEDALLVPHFRSKARTLKEAQAGEHAGDDALKFYTERDWPKCDVIVGNPPFLGGSKLWEELGRHYQQELWRVYESRVPGAADLCCYWFEKAREQVETGNCQRVGLLATQAIRGGVSREVLERVKKMGDIFFAISDKPWILAGADVRVSMVGFDNGKEIIRTLDGATVQKINANLTATTDVTEAELLAANHRVCFQGSQKIGSFEVEALLAVQWLKDPNAHGKPNSDVLKPSWNGMDLARRSRDCWMIDFGTEMSVDESALYEKPFQYVLENVKPERDQNHREAYRRFWWRHGEPRIAMRAAIKSLSRFAATPEVTKHRVFTWLDGVILPDKKLMVVARADDYALGILLSHVHEIWALAQCTWHGIGNDPRYTPTTCFETFPFPFPDDLELPPSKFAPEPPKPPSHPDLTPEKAYADAAHFYSAKEEPPPYQVPCRSRREEALTSASGKSQSLVTSTPTNPADHRAAIAAAAKELNELRERWLNPPEWTETHTLEFPGSVNGPWARYIDPSTLNPQLSTGLVRYPRLVPKDADCAAKLKKRTLTNLYNERPAWLDLAHKKLDAAVAAAYGWVRAGQATVDLTDEQILEKLLALNLERAAEEAKAAKVKKLKAQRTKHAEEML